MTIDDLEQQRAALPTTAVQADLAAIHERTGVTLIGGSSPRGRRCRRSPRSPTSTI